jgi:hypothetical protein
MEVAINSGAVGRWRGTGMGQGKRTRRAVGRDRARDAPIGGGGGGGAGGGGGVPPASPFPPPPPPPPHVNVHLPILLRAHPGRIEEEHIEPSFIRSYNVH